MRWTRDGALDRVLASVVRAAEWAARVEEDGLGSGRADVQAIEERIDRALIAGDLPGAATEALRGYGPHILRYLVAVLHDVERAEEAFSRFSEKLWKGLGSFRADSSFKVWAYEVAWNAAQDLGRDPYRRRSRRLNTHEISNIADEVRSITRPHLQSWAKERLRGLQESLAPDERSLLLLRVEKDLSWREVAQIMSRPERPLDEAAVRKRFERLKSKLRRLALEQGLFKP
jgi:RNA polymerase sigma-70 factor (ECF subfamily)